jgi:hypothetical protein
VPIRPEGTSFSAPALNRPTQATPNSTSDQPSTLTQPAKVPNPVAAAPRVTSPSAQQSSAASTHQVSQPSMPSSLQVPRPVVPTASQVPRPTISSAQHNPVSRSSIHSHRKTSNASSLQVSVLPKASSSPAPMPKLQIIMTPNPIVEQPSANREPAKIPSPASVVSQPCASRPRRKPSDTSSL